MKIGRNEPCPCGSGKKYKKCCLRKHEEEARKSAAASIDASSDVKNNLSGIKEKIKNYEDTGEPGEDEDFYEDSVLDDFFNLKQRILREKLP